MKRFGKISLGVSWLFSFTFLFRALNIFTTLRNEAQSVLSPIYNEFVVQEWVKDKLDHSIHQLENKKTEIEALRKVAAANKWKLRNYWSRNKYNFDSTSGGRIPFRWDWMCLGTRQTSRRRFCAAGQQLRRAHSTVILSIAMDFFRCRHLFFVGRTSSPSTRPWKENSVSS